MPTEVVTLAPTQGSSLTFKSHDTGAGFWLEEVDWGDVAVEANLATGPDIIGVVVGTQRRVERDVTMTLGVEDPAAAQFVAARTALDAVVTAFQGPGRGSIQRQVEYADGSVGVVSELEVLQVVADPDEEWVASGLSFASLSFVCQPYWLTDEELVASLTANTDDVRILTLSGLSGNLPGPARLRIGDVANLVTNSSFETDTTGWASVLSATIQRVTTEAYLGVASLEVSTPGSASFEGVGTSPLIPVDPSKTHTVGAWVKGVEGDSLRIQLNAYDASDAFINGLAAPFTATGDWQLVGVSHAFGAAAVKAEITVLTNTALATTFYVDKAMLDAKARRFIEVGQNWSHPSKQIEYRASQVDPGDGTFVNPNVRVIPTAPAWQTCALLTGLSHRGSFRVRARFNWGQTAAGQITARALYRIGGGDWREARRPVPVPAVVADFREVDLGAIHHHSDNGGTLDLRIQVFNTVVNTGNPLSFNRLTLMPTEGYALGRGELVADISDGGFKSLDDFSVNGALTGSSDDLSNTWAGFGSATDISVGGSSGYDLERTGVADADIHAGRICLVGSSAVGTEAQMGHLGVTRFTFPVVTAEARMALVVRGTDASNMVRAGVSARRLTGGGAGKWLHQLFVVKEVGGVSTTLFQHKFEQAGGGAPRVDDASLSVDSSGAWTLSVRQSHNLGLPSDVVFTGQDPDLALGGSLGSGRVGLFASQNDTGLLSFGSGPFVGLGGGFSTPTTVVREDGIGEFSISGGRRKAFTAEADNTRPAPVPFYRGSGLWLPPGDSRLALRLHPNDLFQEAGKTADYGHAVDIALHHRPAWVTVPDSLEP